MFVIELTYTASLAEIDKQVKAHVAFLNRHYASGRFVVSGRQNPRTGGIIVAIGAGKAEIEALVREDPLRRARPRGVPWVEFRASQRAPDLPVRIS